jgi:alpha-D-ribose 1-methylphosphonate 5-triphosphate synthase subunit PhnI
MKRSRIITILIAGLICVAGAFVAFPAFRERAKAVAFADRAMRVGRSREEVLAAAKQADFISFELNSGVTLRKPADSLIHFVRFQIDAAFGEDDRLIWWSVHRS